MWRKLHSEYEHASLTDNLDTECTLKREGDYVGTSKDFTASAAGNICATSDLPVCQTCFPGGSQVCVYVCVCRRVHVCMKALWYNLVDWACTPVCICRTGKSVCVCLWLHALCVRVWAEVFRLWGIDRAHTQVKPEGSQGDVCTGLWPPTVVQAFTVSIPSSVLPQHHPRFQSKRGHRWSHSISHDCPTAETFPYLLFLAQQVHPETKYQKYKQYGLPIPPTLFAYSKYSNSKHEMCHMQIKIPYTFFRIRSTPIIMKEMKINKNKMLTVDATRFYLPNIHPADLLHKQHTTNGIPLKSLQITANPKLYFVNTNTTDQMHHLWVSSPSTAVRGIWSVDWHQTTSKMAEHLELSLRC